MSATIDYLPIWKKDATACDRLHEVAEIARKFPERFNRLLIAYEETLDDGSTMTRYSCNGVDTTTLLGLLEQVKEEVHVVTRGARMK